MSELQLDPDLIATLAALEAHRVEFVLVGDVANAIYNHGGVVAAVAIVPASYGRNTKRLAHALDAMQAEPGVAGRADVRHADWRSMDLRDVAPCSFMTMYADVDLDFRPAGCSGYPDLFQDAARIELASRARPYVASPEDLDRLAHRSTPAPGASPPMPSPQASSAPAMQPADVAPMTVLPPEPDWLEEEIRASMARAGLHPERR